MSLKGKKIVVTSGPTWVPIDDVRVISNQSTGEMGRLLAQALVKQGARVTLLEGPVQHPTRSQKSLKVMSFQTLNELVNLLNKQLTSATKAVIHAAAVADYAPKTIKKSKIVSDLPEITLTLVKTPKIINTIKLKAPEAVLVGFKLQSTMSQKDAVTVTRKLFTDASCDLVVANAKMPSSYKAYVVGPQGIMSPTLNSKKKVVNQLIKHLESQLK